MVAKVIKTTGPVPAGKKTALAGLRPAYWTVNGITLFVFEDDWLPSYDAANGGIIDAEPGMVGVDYSFSSLYIVLLDGECEKLCDLRDEGARVVMGSVKLVEAL